MIYLQLQLKSSWKQGLQFCLNLISVLENLTYISWINLINFDQIQKKKKEIIFSVSYMLAGEGGVRNFKNSSWNCNPWLEVRLCLHSATITTRIQEQIIHMPAADLFVFMCIYYIYTSMSELINESKF